MNFPLPIPDSLKQHLRALRKSRGLTQAQLGALLGVKQARIAEIEAKPGAVSLEQLIKVLAALGGSLHLHAAAGPAGEPATRSNKAAAAPKAAPATRGAVVIRRKKGAW